MKNIKEISGNIVDIIHQEIFSGTLIIKKGKISDIIRTDNKKYENYILPGFVDSHIHIESSMLTPVEFSRIATIHGTVATVSDPHEIANVLGIDGVKYMIENAEKTPLKFYFSAPSCVPATNFETNGARIGPSELEELLKIDKIKYIGEVMNFPAVINKEPEMMQKINLTKRYGKLLDGHTPGLRGKDLKNISDPEFQQIMNVFQKKKHWKKFRFEGKCKLENDRL